MILKQNVHSDDPSWSFQQKELDFIDRILTYSTMAFCRETSHTMNNLLTSLTIYISMLKNNLNKGNIDKAYNGIEAIEKSLNNITEFTTKLSRKANYTQNVISVKPNSEVRDALTLCSILFKESRWSLITEFCEMDSKLQTDSSIIQMALVTWFSMNLKIYNFPSMIVQTMWEPEGQQYAISCTVTAKKGDSASAIIYRESGERAGEIPLITMKRIIHSNFKFADLKIIRSEGNDFILTLSPV